MMKLFYKINSATARHLVITINRESLDPFAMVSIQGGWTSFRVEGVLDSILRFDYFNCSAYISKGDVITAYWCYGRFSSQLICLYMIVGQPMKKARVFS